MKGFPNQVSDLDKLTKALHIASELIRGRKGISDSVYGEALVRGGVAGTGHTRRPVDEYLAEQRKKTRSNRSYETTARGLRELFRILNLLRDDQLSPNGKLIATHNDLTREARKLWRRVIRNMVHHGDHGDFSHPYQVLLRLIGKRPGITRAKCALALEARDDSEEELDRIAKLSDSDEDFIIASLGVTQTNWNNAKKILPSFAEQLGDAIKVGHEMYLADAPGRASTTDLDEPKKSSRATGTRLRKPKSASKVNAKSIAKAGTLETFDEDEAADESSIPTAAEVAARRKKLADRLKRHNELVQRFAVVCERNGAELYENPFDCLACFENAALLIEAKTLDGTGPDEQIRVRESLGQVLYYEAFVTVPYADTAAVIKISLFENRISDEHQEWLRVSGILTVWTDGENFYANDDATQTLAPHLGVDIKSS